MKKLLLALSLAALGWAQPFSSNAKKLRGKEPCSATVTTNCVPVVSALGAYVPAIAGEGHTQGTDAGTTGSSFQIDSDNSGCRWKNNAGVMELRNAADDAYCALKVDSLETTGTGDWTLVGQTARTAPASGLTFWADTTTHTLRAIYDDNTTSTTVIADTGTAGQFITAISPGGVISKAAPSYTPPGIEMTFDGGGSAITAGSKGYKQVYTACTIAEWTILGVGGTATIDIWRVASGTALPTNAATITAGAEPALSSNEVVRSTTMTGWCGDGSCEIAANDILGFNFDSGTATWARIELRCTR